MDFAEKLEEDIELELQDFNKNSRTLTTDTREIYAKTSDELSTVSAFTMDLPAPFLGAPAAGASERQTQPEVPGLTSDIDDAINNDFFYDEEFTIPFDANLVEDCRSLDPASRLRMVLPGGAGDEDLDWQRGKMALSKSDSCLYQADQEELSGSDGEMSTSEHDGTSSSNNSPLQNQSLFSSGGEPGCEDVSGCRAEISDSAMSGSLSRDDTVKYDYDWSEGKQQYILLFDRSPTKTCSSDDESCHQVAGVKTRAKITSWLRAKTSKTRRKGDEPNPGGDPVGKTGEERRTSSGLTTWGQVKSEGVDARGNGLTTWQEVKEWRPPCSFRDALAVARNGKEGRRTDVVVEELSPPHGKTINAAVEVKILPDEACRSRKLFDFYCKLKSPDEMSEFVNNEGMASPPLSAEKLVDPWVQSLITGSPGKVVDTICDTNTGNSILHEKLTWNETDEVDLGKTNGGIRDDVVPAVGSDGNVSARSPDRNTNAEQAGSPVLTASLLRCHDTVDCSIQFPPASMDCSVQTSFQFSGSNQSSVTESKAQQTSAIASSVSLPRNVPPGDATDSVRAESKMVRSAHLLSRPLPDLSFLNKSTNQQVGETDEVRSAQRERQSESRNAKVRQISKVIYRRSLDAKASSSSDSRESSPNPVLYRNRSRSSDSTSTYSVCSTSSSGIDPGFCDSSGSGARTPRHSRIFDEVVRMAPIQPVEFSRTTPKPPGAFPADQETTLQNQALNVATKTKEDNDHGNVVGLCNACNSQIFPEKVDARNLANSDPTFYQESQGRSSATKQFDYLHISPTHSRSRGSGDNSPPVLRRLNHDSLTHRHGSPRLPRGKDHHVVLRGNQQPTAKPAKSILVRRRQRNQAKRRSWSNPSCDIDDFGPPRGYLPSYLVSEGRPLSLPDEDLLHLGPSGVLEEQDESQTTCDASEDQTRVGRDDETDVEDEIDGDYEHFRAKKSVSFSEKIFYHSTSATDSPLDSPRCLQAELGNSPAPAAPTSLAVPTKPAECKYPASVNDSKTDPDDSELPPTDFVVSPNVSPSSSLSSSDLSLSTDILHKRELVFDVMRAVEVLLKHFSQTRDPSKKVQLGSTMEDGDIGRLVLDHLCPAIHAVILHGLKPHVNSLFGRVKNSAYKVMEDSAELGGQPVELIQDLVKSLKSLKFLNTPRILFNAFIFGLLNYKALDFWLTFVHNHKPLLAKHYTTSSFIHLGNSSTRRLFFDVVTSLQPLAQMPFRLEYGFESRFIERRQDEQLAEHLLDEHASCSVETYVEGRKFSTRLHDLRATESSKLKQRTKELWRRTQRQLLEKLSESRERLLASESMTLVRSVARAAVVGRPRPVSFPGTFQRDDDASDYGNFLRSAGSIRNLSRGDSGEFEGSGNEGGLAESSGSESDGGFFAKVTRQLNEMNPNGRVYRRGGATDYDFEESFSSFSSSQKIDPRNENLMSDVATCRASDTASHVTSVVPSSDVRSDRVESSPSAATPSTGVGVGMSSATTPTENSVTGGNSRTASPAIMAPAGSAKVVTTLRTSTDSTCTSDTALLDLTKPSREPPSSSPAARLTNSSRLDGSASRKRWSDIGGHLVSIFDRLLLSDTKVTSSVTSSSVTSSSTVTSSSVVKCSSAGQISAAASLADVQRSRLKRLSSSAGENRFVRAESLDSAKSDPKAFEPSTSGSHRRAVTLCHYVATDSRQLSFEKGTAIAVLQDCKTEWKLCRVGKTVGLVHNACIRPDDASGRNSPR